VVISLPGPRWKWLLAVALGLGALSLAALTIVAAQPAKPQVLVGAGDIGSCSSKGDEITAKLLDDLPGTVFTLGDNAYYEGSPRQFADCYGSHWGRHRARTRPVIGNHDVITDNGGPYYDYFGTAAGNRGEGWYSYKLGDWLVLALNSNCDVVGCDAGSAQAKWLEAELEREQPRCAVAMWHHPLFTSGHNHPPETRLRPLFEILYNHGVELLLTGHNHQYERFAPQTPDALLDEARGVREFVAGTGGAGLYKFQPEPAANSEVRDGKTLGVLKLELHEDSYSWQFVGQPDKPFTDSGSTPCH
jgi:alkaline phosphatase